MDFDLEAAAERARRRARLEPVADLVAAPLSDHTCAQIRELFAQGNTRKPRREKKAEEDQAPSSEGASVVALLPTRALTVLESAS